MFKKILSYALTVVLVAVAMPLGLTYGSNERDQLNEIQNVISKTQQDIDRGKREERNLLTQIQNLETQMRATQAEIETLRGNIADMEQRIEKALAELEALEADLKEQSDNLNARLSAMYMNGNIGILDVLLGSSSISDFMINMDRIQLIYESDRELMEYLEEQFRIMESHKNFLQKMQDDLIAEREKEANKREALRKNQQDTAVKKAEVELNNKLLEEIMDALLVEANRLIQEILSKQSDEEYVGGALGWPVPGRISSEFGYRIHPILKDRRLHTGIDIACPTGTRVVAANAGRVMMAGWNNSYGYVVMVDHGGGIVTLYAHNSSLSVKEGDIVTRGQTIALSGSTGMSTGPHLHFEVRVNGHYKDPMPYLI